mmetsp:Transcript_57842/g.179724  ORF Transcript_57842/g.179724 Transcript_57842/m.179724 type:complete len:213 (+) Transcript_57842:508-1146(+)
MHRAAMSPAPEDCLPEAPKLQGCALVAGKLSAPQVESTTRGAEEVCCLRRGRSDVRVQQARRRWPCRTSGVLSARLRRRAWRLLRLRRGIVPPCLQWIFTETLRVAGLRRALHAHASSRGMQPGFQEFREETQEILSAVLLTEAPAMECDDGEKKCGAEARRRLGHARSRGVEQRAWRRRPGSTAGARPSALPTCLRRVLRLRRGPAPVRMA